MITLTEIVKDFMIEEERDTTHKQGIYLHHAINAVRDLHYDTNGVVKSKAITVDTTNNTAPLPRDFIKEVGVATQDATGRLVNLSREKHSIFKNLDDCGNPATTTANAAGFDSLTYTSNTFSQHFKNGENIGAFFGIGGRQVTGAFKINVEAGRIEFSSGTSITTVILKYLAEPSQVNGQFNVHEYLREPIKNYIDWKDKVRKRYISPNEKAELQRKYVASKTWARMRLTSFDFKEAQEIAKINVTQSPKM